ncbi:DUF1570 domain-containing protein [Schlesneria sp.]|uniref:DUF1570 domain-containing protein n=1 Tax=Schlesneria sp. TaxID=2762018 RepID=UPI002F149CF9
MPNRSLLYIGGLLLLVHPAFADTFTVREDDGNLASVEARWVGEGQGSVAIERTDGRIEVIPQHQILKREAGPDPEPISCTEMARRLTERFGADKFRVYTDAPFVIGLVLSAPLPKQYEAKAAACLKKGAAFMSTVERVFLNFVNDLKIETEKPRYPLVLLIFETDDDFVRFTAEESGGRGLSAKSILGYYSGLTNRLVIRMSECHTFETPLHEAIHQQVYNRGLMQRLSAAPVWFNEGIATGFEGNGDKINGGPLRVSARYARAALKATTVDWDEVVSDDKAFRGDVLAGEAYAHAWSIHWFLVTRYRQQYVEYLKLLGQKPTLGVDDSATRLADFANTFGKPVGDLQAEFRVALEQTAKKQRVFLDEKPRVGHSLTQLNLAEVEMTALTNSTSSIPVVEGRMRNMSQIRPMSFLITIETNAGSYAEWYLPNVPPQKISPLPRQSTDKEMKGSPGGPAQTFRIKVRAAIPESEAGRLWQRGKFPVPEWTEN